MSLDQEAIAQQLALLAAHRRTLAHLLQQAAQYGGEVFAPTQTANGMVEARAEIARIKAVLREGGVQIVDEPNEGIFIGEQHIYFQPSTTALDRQQQRNRRAMLAKVKAIWITGLLDKSLAKETRIALGLTEQPDAVDLPLKKLIQELNHPASELPAGTPIISVFDQMDGTLLILGAPGAGKTTLLLELTRDLIARAEGDENFPIPVVFNLSSWATKRPPLKDWLVEELNQRYDVPKKTAQGWVEAAALLPLLDGLDEVAVKHRSACVAAINSYRQDEQGLLPLVVCSRAADYEALTIKLRLRGGVLVQPLTMTQIGAYLEKMKLRGSALLRDALPLVELLDTPLKLKRVILAYEDQLVKDQQEPITADEHQSNRLKGYVTSQPISSTEAAFRPIVQPTDVVNIQREQFASPRVNHTDIEFTIRSMLPTELHPAVPKLAQHLADTVNGLLSQEATQERLASEPSLVPLLQALVGQRVMVANIELLFGQGNTINEYHVMIGDMTLGSRIKLTINLGLQRSTTAEGGLAISNVTQIGEQIDINTGGGDYAEGNIDKRQGAFVSGGTVRGNVVGTNLGTVTANYYYQQWTSQSPALHQLRAPLQDFVGRQHEVDQLVEALSRAATNGVAAAISGVRGMGGIGKTELAYKVAHQLRDAFPDAQILVELRGASSNPLTPEQALQAIIRSFERGAKLPDDLSQLQGIYRSVLTGKLVLILADDAKDAAQIRPLLPPAGCALLVTSRNRFSLSGMMALDLEILQPEEAERLLLGICLRIQEYAGELARLCAYLPLALRVSASLLEANDSRDVARYLEQLEKERLKYLSDPDDIDDPQASVEASLRLSYDTLDTITQRVLCQLSVFPSSFSKIAATAVAKTSDRNELIALLLYYLQIRLEEQSTDLENVLGNLRQRCLLEWDTKVERYNLHDLIREFASFRLRNSYVVKLRFKRYSQQMMIRADELIKQGGQSALDGLNLFLTVALDTGNRRIQGQALRDLGNVYINLKQPNHALESYRQALDIAQKVEDSALEMQILDALCTSYADLEDYEHSTKYCIQFLNLVKESGDQRREGYVRNRLATLYSGLNKIDQAAAEFTQSLAIAREVDDRSLELQNLLNLEMTYRSLGETLKIVAIHEQMIKVAPLEVTRLVFDKIQHTFKPPDLSQIVGYVTEPEIFLPLLREHLQIIKYFDTNLREVYFKNLKQVLRGYDHLSMEDAGE